MIVDIEYIISSRIRGVTQPQLTPGLKKRQGIARQMTLYLVEAMTADDFEVEKTGLG